MEKRFNISFNPLLFIEFDKAFNKDLSKVPLDTILGALCWPYSGKQVSDLHKRYQKITNASNNLIYAPVEDNILSKIVWPLRQAKANFILGNSIGTIALSGYVAEMMCILIFDMAKINLNGNVLDKKSQEYLLGRDFEKLGQKRRIDVIFSLKLINEDIKNKFLAVKNIRNRYLHFLSKDENSIETDAIEIFKLTVDILIDLIGQEIEANKLKLKPSIYHYLEEKGLLK